MARSERLNPVTIRIIRILRQLEEQCKVRCLLVYNPYRKTGWNPYVFGLWVCPLPGEARNDPGFQERAAESWQLFGQLQPQWRNWDTVNYLGNSDWTEWFVDHADNPEALINPRVSGWEGVDFLSEPIYGLPIVREFHAQAKAYFGPDIFDRWQAFMASYDREWRDNLWPEMKPAMYRALQERTWPLNQWELDEIRGFLRRFHGWVEDIKAYYPQDAVEHAVALEGSGRPLGKAIEIWYEGRIPVTYLDPRHLRDRFGKIYFSWSVFDDRAGLELARKTLEAEFPELYQLLVRNPRRVLFVDDQFTCGRTTIALWVLTRYLSEDSSSSDLTMSRTIEEFCNAPSWLHRRDLQGIRTYENRFTFRTQEVPTPESEWFYACLESHVRAWKAEIGR